MLGIARQQVKKYLGFDAGRLPRRSGASLINCYPAK
jgi:hypothetical protein